MEILDAAECAVRGLVPFLELGCVAARDEAAGREVDPVVEGVGSAFEHLLRRQWGRSARLGRGGGAPGEGRRSSGEPERSPGGHWCPPPKGRRQARRDRAKLPSTGSRLY